MKKINSLEKRKRSCKNHVYLDLEITIYER